MTIKLNTLGEILKGDDAGFFIKILDDSEDTGGYLILLSEDKAFKKGFDDWVESWSDLEEYFLESEWKIKWFETKNS